jgi:hypothetical protein
MMQIKTVCKVCAWAGAICIGSFQAALAQPCGTPAGSDGAALYPLPQDGDWGFVDRDGEWRLAPEWRQVRPFSEGVASVETAAGWGLIDRAGSYLVRPGAEDADSIVISGKRFALSPFKPMSQGCSAATPADGTPHYITADGDTWTPPAFEGREVRDIGSFSDGRAWVRLANDRVGWIDSDGQMAIAPDFIDGGDFVDGHAPAAVNTENRGYIDRSGELAFPRKFILQEAARHTEGRAPVRIGGEAGYMDNTDWVIREITMPDGKTRALDAVTPFSDGRAAVRPAGMSSGPVWIDTKGSVVVAPQSGARLTICSDTRLPTYRDGLLPLVVGDGTNICGNTPDISYEGPGDPRSGPERMLWHLPWERDKLVWLDRDGVTVIDSTACRRAQGVAALPTETNDGDLAPGAYRMALAGMVQGKVGPHRADAPCNRSEFKMDGNQATNARGPWTLSLTGTARWQGETVDLSLSLGLPQGVGTGTHQIGPTGEDDLPSAYLWMSVRDAGPNAPRPATYTSAGGGGLTLARRDQGAITGRAEITFVSRDDPADTVTLTADFDEIPYSAGPEVTLVETTGAVTALDASMPDDPLINFFTPAKAVESEDRLVLSLGKFGPKLELDFPAGHSGAFTAGAEAPVSITFAGMPVSAKGRLERSPEGHLRGDLTAKLGAHEQVDGAGSVTLRFADIPLESAE